MITINSGSCTIPHKQKSRFSDFDLHHSIEISITTGKINHLLNNTELHLY